MSEIHLLYAIYIDRLHLSSFLHILLFQIITEVRCVNTVCWWWKWMIFILQSPWKKQQQNQRWQIITYICNSVYILIANTITCYHKYIFFFRFLLFPLFCWYFSVRIWLKIHKLILKNCRIKCTFVCASILCCLLFARFYIYLNFIACTYVRFLLYFDILIYYYYI